MVMKYDESAELEDKSACAGVRADLKMCLLESECCRGVSIITYLLKYFIERKRENSKIKIFLKPCL